MNVRMEWSKRRDKKKKRGETEPKQTKPLKCIERKPEENSLTHIRILRPTTQYPTYTKYSILNVLHSSEQSKACGNIKQAIFVFHFFFIVPIFRSHTANSHSLAFAAIFVCACVSFSRHFSTFQQWKFVHSKCIAAREQCQMKIHGKTGKQIQRRPKINEKWQLFFIPCHIRTTRWQGWKKKKIACVPKNDDIGQSSILCVWCRCVKWWCMEQCA